MFTHLEEILLSYADTLPLPLFSFVASLVEEVIAPIPSPAVMIIAGTVASLQGMTIADLLLLSVIAALGKTVGALFIYFVSGKLEEVVMGKFGGFFGVTYADIEKFRTRLTGGYRDYFLLTLFRTLPFVPSTLVSIGCGLLKVPLKLYIVCTMIGTIFRDIFYLYFGFMGTAYLGTLIEGSSSLESIIQGLALLTIILGLLFVYMKRRKKEKPISPPL